MGVPPPEAGFEGRSRVDEWAAGIVMVVGLFLLASLPFALLYLVVLGP